MHLLMRRYSRSGYASRWFLRLLAAGFACLGAWAVVRSDWLVVGLALVMAVITFAAVPLTRRLSEGLRESNRAIDADQEARHG